MSDDDTAGPSLLLAQHDTAHREHSRSHGKLSQHRHHWLHKKQADTVEEVVTEIISVSVIAQIDIDSNGNLFTVRTTLSPDSTAGTSPPAVVTSDSAPVTTDSLMNPSNPFIDSQASSTTTALPSLLSVLGESTALTSTPLISSTSTFASLITSSNSTALISSSSSLPLSQTFSNSSRSSTTRLSLSKFNSSTSVSLSSTISTSSLYSPSDSSYVATATDAGIVGAGTGVFDSTESTSTSNADTAENSSGGLAPQTKTVVGAVLGGLAGAALILLAVLYILRWKKRQNRMVLSSGDGGSGSIRDVPPTQPSGTMTERRSVAAFVPAALANLTKPNKRHTHQTDHTISSTAGSERGFVRVSGRKLPSVFQHGGDGYGGGIPDDRTMSETSFYRDSQGFYGGPGGPVSPPLGISMQRDSGIPVMRPGPARTPVTEHGPTYGSPFADPPIPPSPPRRPDALGRSHPSQDGSHTSKFTEEV